MQRSFIYELWLLAGLVLVALFIGLLIGMPLGSLAVALAIYLALLLRHLNHLQGWLQSKKAEDIPEATGLWGDIFDEIRTLTKEAGKREDRLADTLARFQSASAAMPDAMLILTQRNHIEWANSAAERHLGIAFPRDYKLPIANLLRDPGFIAYLEHGDYADAVELPSPTQPNKRLTMQIFPYGSNQKLVIFHDVTHLAHLEEMRRNFVGNISHELRTPLTVVSGYIETLKDMQNIAPEELHKHLDSMHEQTLRMRHLVDDLLTLSKLETSPATAHETLVNIPALLAELQKTAQALSGKRNHQITLETQDNLLLRGNESELRSALSNLINNAVQYTPDQGTIQLRWSCDNHAAYFSVTDNGYGIATQHIPHLTERFYRVDSARSRATGGTGLGLSIVKHILLRHEAKLTISSQIGRGSTFTCMFPATRVQITK